VYICECLEFNGECFPVNMFYLEKLNASVCRIGVFGFGRQNIRLFFINCCEPLVMCIMYYLFTHTFVAPHRCIDIVGALLDFFNEKPNDQYLVLICDEPLTCRGLNSNSFTLIPCFVWRIVFACLIVCRWEVWHGGQQRGS
jgi:hypothetical protein